MERRRDTPLGTGGLTCTRVKFTVALAAAMDALLPRHCLMCGLPSGAENLCAPCRADLPRSARRCERCGLPLPGHGDRVCGPCLHRPPSWDRVLAALDYRFPADALVQRFKFNRSHACGRVLCLELATAVREAGSGLPRPDALVPVPLHRGRHLSRLFNQSELLARFVGRHEGIPVHCRLLRRVRPTRAQSGLDAKSRRRNTRGAFHCHPRRAAGLGHVALVDDVMTTGATLDACVRELKRAGIAEVTLWVAARAPPP